jgi:MOSC domain-containing protein YiiM
MSALVLRLLSVNVARPKRLGEQDGAEVISAIAKMPVAAATIALTPTNLDGDAQSDLVHHGGPDKAVYAYPSDHWTWWEGTQRFPCAPGAFGENLTLAGAVESDLAIGDRFAWGECELEVSQPRVPCYKFQLYSGRADASALMTLSARTGWYFRVTKSGRAPVGAATLLRVAASGGPSVREAFAAAFDPRYDAGKRRTMLKLPALSDAWRARLTARGG